MNRDDQPRPEGAPEPDKRVSVMTWLVDVGHAVAKKLRGVPASPLARIHE
jgi:hypothetical protein